MIYKTNAYRVFMFFNTAFLVMLATACLVPMINVLAVSFSSKIPIASGEVKLWPVGFQTDAYKYLLQNSAFWTSMQVSFKRILLGGIVNMTIIILSAYPLSKSAAYFKSRKYYVWYMLITILLNGGLIPTFLVVRYTGLIDTIWALIIPGAVPVFSIILLLNFFRQLPKEMSEAAYVDGAGEWTILWRVYVPVSKPALATLLLFTLVGHWNAWFDGLIYMNRPEHYPLQSYMQTIVIRQDFTVQSVEIIKQMQKLDNKAIISAQIFIGMLPVMMVYPFLQKYFTKGIVLGSVKG